MHGKAKIDLIKAFMQFNGNLRLDHTTYNYNGDGGVMFSGHHMDDSNRPISVVMDMHQLHAVMDCRSITELHDCYNEMGYF